MTTQAIHTAKIESIKELGENSTEIVIKPLYYGYGNTLGNSLRRVLLSSIKGAAITAFSIEGSNHEFAAIPGIREDVVDIMLNLKNIRFKIEDEKTSRVELSLEIKGSDQSKKDGDARVIAKDIKLPAGVSVSNPNQVICHIDNPKHTLRMRFIVESGIGYLTADQSASDKTYADMISIDAVFSPVVRVRYKVENTRVGRDTNLQQLAITIDTDGTISPHEAFRTAAANLREQYASFADGKIVETADSPSIEKEEVKTEFNAPIETLNLTARTTNALINNDIKNLNQLIELGEQEMRDLKGFGNKALSEVNEKIAELTGDVKKEETELK